MLQKLVLHNFQAHKALALELAPGITTITGDSDAGKSAIVRALTWVLLNSPAGDEFIRWGTENTKSCLMLDGDNMVVRRRKGKAGNTYHLDEKEFKAFGQAVPDEIQKLLKVEDINVQRQFDPPFWFSLSAGEVSKRLNQIINLEIIDTAMGEVAGKLRHFKSEVQVSEERLKEAKDTLELSKHAPAMDTALQQVEQLAHSARQIGLKRTQLASLIQTASQHSQTRKRASAAAEVGGALAKTCLEAWERRAVVVGKMHKLRYLIQESEKHSTNKRNFQHHVEDLHSDLHKKLNGQCPLCGGKMK